MPRLNGKVAIVTGAAAGQKAALGSVFARALAAEGAKVVVADVKDCSPVAAEIAANGGTAHPVIADVRDPGSVTAMVAETVKIFGRLDILVNNAATYSGTALLDTSAEQWERVMAVNLTGMFNGCKRAVQQMLTQEPRDEVRGRLINLGSQHGIVAARGDSPYGVSKAGAIYLTRQIAVDYAKDLIVCNCISPGKIVTGKPGLAMDPANLENARRRTPWPRLGRPQDIANAAVFLASDRATFMTGSNLVIDGGWLAG
jgi:glucose 1-dehydrogenase